MGEWYGWIKDRVENDYGYKTPTSPPKLYPQGMREEFERWKQQREKEHDSEGSDDDDSDEDME